MAWPLNSSAHIATNFLGTVYLPKLRRLEGLYDPNDVLLISAGHISKLPLHLKAVAMAKLCLFWLLALPSWTQPSRAELTSLREPPLTPTKRADTNLVGYLGAFFLGADPYVYLYQSNGNSPTSFRALNRGQPVIRPTRGTGGVRDPAIVQGGGQEEGQKWYIVGTDLNIAKVWCLPLDPGSGERRELTPTDELGCCPTNWLSRHIYLGKR